MRTLYFSAFIALLCTTGCHRGYHTQYGEEVIEETYVHKYGVEVPPNYWVEKGKHGTVLMKRADGVVVSKNYSGGILDGETTYTFPHNQIVQKKEIYQNNMPIGETLYYFDGTPMNEFYSHPDTTFKDVNQWYVNGFPKSSEKYDGDRLLSGKYFNSANQQDSFVDNYEGKRIVRDDYGQLISVETIQQGQVILSTTNHPNGSPKEEIPYRNGLIDGVKKTYLPAGEPVSVEEWSNGKQNGLTTLFQNGERYAEIPYKDGAKNGVERHYRDGTIVLEEIGWENDLLHGPSKHYIGENVKTEWYYKGRPIARSNFEALTADRNHWFEQDDSTQ